MLITALAAGALCCASVAAGPACFESSEIDLQGRQLFHTTCSHCHGLNMVNGGTTVYDLRKFPVQDSERFLNSVTNGKGNMPSFKESLTPVQIKLLWAYVGSRGGKEP